MHLADSRTRVRNGDAPLMPPRYLHLDLPKRAMRNFHIESEQVLFASTYLAR